MEIERRKKNMTQNRARNVANKSKRPDQARAVDGDDDEINVGFYPNELQPNSVQDNLDPPASMNETEPDSEQDITADNVQNPTNEPEADPEQDQMIAVDHADHAQDQNILQPPYNAPEHDDAVFSPDAEPPPRPKRTRLPPTRLMYATPYQDNLQIITSIIFNKFPDMLNRFKEQADLN
eukprot:Seg749.3 transcript_id=Seg749.3/GoldUCD/mRNA.D3Y31 product="hypothetical protein" protein_id=Seg749.3/GoldUCD/D3Y31